MKLRYNRLSIFCMLLMIILSMGCENRGNPTISPTPEITAEATPTVTPMITPTDIPRNFNPLNLEGYKRHVDEEALDEADNVYLLSILEMNNRINEEFVTNFEVLSYQEDCIVVSYMTAPEESDYIEGENSLHHFVKLSTDTLEVVKHMEVNGDVYVQKIGDTIAIEYRQEHSWYVKTYDMELNEIAVLETPDGTAGCVSSDGKRCYYVLDRNIYRIDYSIRGLETIEVADNFMIIYLNGVLSDEVGNDYLILWGMAADYKEYHAILDVANGKLVRIHGMQDRSYVLMNNCYLEYIISDFYTTEWIAGISQNMAYDYVWNGAEVDVQLYILKNKDVFFTYTENGMMHCMVYEYETGKLVGATSFDVSWLAKMGTVGVYGEENPSGGDIYVYVSPIYIDEDTLLLQIANYGNYQFLLEWNLTLDEEISQNMEVKEYKIGSSPSIDISKMDNPLYKPQKINDSLKPLRKRANNLEEKFGVDIFIGEECANILGGYTIKPLLEYDLIEDALDIIEIQMTKYPEDFFRQFTYDWIEGVDIYLASTLKGVGEGVLNYASGFKTLYDSNVLLVLDCTDTYGMPSTFHHELSHVIEEKILDERYKKENPVFDESVWMSFNPYEDMYTYTYEEYGKQEYWKYTYQEAVWNEENVENCYFVDSYAMTYPSEDRARLFESVMSNNLFDIDFDIAPHLTDKLNYYAKCIRDVFDTSGWKNVPWEAYMD